MYVKEMVLKNYKRLYVSNIKEITYRPHQPFNIILGNNGSGKSSLLKEIFPNVEELNLDYDQHGYKKVTYLHHGRTYVLSYYRDDNVHSFIVDGVELNQQGIKKTQRILIEEHFKLTKPIHELLLSANNFTTMSVSERKHWFTKILTTVDYEYALKLYNNSKLRIKELTSFIKLTRSKLLKDDDLLKHYTKEYIDKVKYDIKILHNLLEHLINKKINIDNIDKPDIRKLGTLVDTITDDDIDIIKHYSKLKNDKIILTTEIKMLSRQVDDINKKLIKINSIKIDTDVSLTDINNNYNKLKKDLDTILSILPIKMDIDELINFITIFQNNYNNIISALIEVKDIDIKDIDKNKLQYDIQILEKKIQDLNNDFININNDFTLQKKLKEQDDITCPKCKNIFKPNYDEKAYDVLYKQITDITTKKEDLIKKYSNITELLNKVNIVNEHITIVEQLLYSNRYLYNYIKKETDGFKNIRKLYDIITNIHITLPNIDKVIKIKEDLEEAKSKQELYSKLSMEKVKYIQDKKKELLEQRIDCIDKLNNKKDRLNIINSDIKRIELIKDNIEEIKNIYDNFLLYKKHKIEILHNRFINNLIIEVKKEITILETNLLDYENIKKKYTSLEIELRDYENRLKAAKDIEGYLSPSKGIIGESINNTINYVLERMNALISEVWSYEIHILPCNIEKNDLTFRFPVKIGNVKEIPDVNKGSNSIKEIIDLSFKIVVMEFLDMLDYPLILDEFGRTMDPKHRIKAYDFIEELSKSYFSQIYLVSHFESMFARFKNTDVIILDNSNVGYSGSYNNVIKIK